MKVLRVVIITMVVMVLASCMIIAVERKADRETRKIDKETRTDDTAVTVRLFVGIEGAEQNSMMVKRDRFQETEIFIGTEDLSEYTRYREFLNDDGYFVQEFIQNGKVLFSIKTREQ